DNPEGQQYPHNLLQPLPLIPDNRGHRVIPFAHFINNDLEYLRGEKDYPLTDVVLLLMLSAKLQVDEDCEMARDLVMKIFMEANKPKRRRTLELMLFKTLRKYTKGLLLLVEELVLLVQINAVRQRYMHDPLTWKFTNCRVHQVLSIRRHDIFILTEKDYPLTDVVLLLMLSAKLQVDEDCEMARDLVMKIFMEGYKPKSRRSLDISSN
nr:hypothetical protein [Tanacetum cinerariifolium]